LNSHKISGCQCIRFQDKTYNFTAIFLLSLKLTLRRFYVLPFGTLKLAVCLNTNHCLYLFSTRHCSLLRLIVRSGLDRSNFRHQTSSRVSSSESTQRRKVELWARNVWEFCLNAGFHVTFRDLFIAAKLRHKTDGFTSPPKECVLRIFFALKIRRLRPGANPRTKASTLPLDHRSRLTRTHNDYPKKKLKRNQNSRSSSQIKNSQVIRIIQSNTSFIVKIHLYTRLHVSFPWSHHQASTVEQIQI
jgi:hypothetical protein